MLIRPLKREHHGMARPSGGGDGRRPQPRPSNGVAPSATRRRRRTPLPAVGLDASGRASPAERQPCRTVGAKFTAAKVPGPRTPEGLERSRRANWKHGRFRGKPTRNDHACGRQYLRSAIRASWNGSAKLSRMILDGNQRPNLPQRLMIGALAVLSISLTHASAPPSPITLPRTMAMVCPLRPDPA